ncbi:MAG: hypothetical protein ACR2NL_06160 [Acidimicrobiia bacterium]
MRRLLTILAALALLTAACGSTASSQVGASDVVENDPAAVEDSAADEAEVASDQEEPASDDPVAAEAVVEDEVESVAPDEPESEEPAELRTGREAILANHSEGKPYVLFYWGAH